MIILILIFIGFISFFGLLYATSFLSAILGFTGDSDLVGICLMGTVIICCTYLIISKLNDIKKSIESNE
ncbi:hypothetical protein AN2V17_35990 [Vallitalea sp. AN17-2]|uniref:Uncharacterized protein n=1 Tax=Vallitalea maricola TaxID=3074433 RepID=A0ACB5UN09_9FIRM|nr:hypothetical protein AN2V17_35990 [Vallitalea sp. AN17-2]